MITQAACLITFDEGKTVHIIPLHRHGDISKILKAFGYKPHKGYKILEQGFIDNHGNFFDRIEAMNEAKMWKQPLIGEEKEKLFSENLY